MNARKPSNTLDDHTHAGLPESALNVYAPESNTFSPEDYAVGQVISGRFRVEHVIGIGSMGIVLAARHLELDDASCVPIRIRAALLKCSCCPAVGFCDGWSVSCRIVSSWSYRRNNDL
jgi:hypothetical protein